MSNPNFRVMSFKTWKAALLEIGRLGGYELDAMKVEGGVRVEIQSADVKHVVAPYVRRSPNLPPMIIVPYGSSPEATEAAKVVATQFGLKISIATQSAKSRAAYMRHWRRTRSKMDLDEKTAIATQSANRKKTTKTIDVDRAEYELATKLEALLDDPRAVKRKEKRAKKILQKHEAAETLNNLLVSEGMAEPTKTLAEHKKEGNTYENRDERLSKERINAIKERKAQVTDEKPKKKALPDWKQPGRQAAVRKAMKSQAVDVDKTVPAKPSKPLKIVR